MISSKFMIPIAVMGVTLLSCGTEESESDSNIDHENQSNSDTLTLNVYGASSPFILIEEDKMDNLQIFFVEGKTTLDDISYVTLNVALEKGMVKLYETGDVQELKLDNNSENFIFIHAGDVVKGGKQDRTIRFDVIIAPKSKENNLASFCVEAQRWNGRGDELSGSFHSNSVILTSKNLKLASKYKENQSEVWSEVSEQQSKLSANVSKYANYDVNVQDNASSSSLQLALENKELNELKEKMKVHFQTAYEKHPNAVGFAYAINGEFYGMDLYNNHQLFNDLWDKLIESSIVEAIGDMDSTKFEIQLSVEEIKSQCALIDMSAEGSHEDINKITRMDTREGKGNEILHFTTLDLAHNSTWIHQNYLTKDSTDNKSKGSMIQTQQNNINIYEGIDY